VFLLSDGHFHSTRQTCSLIRQIWQGQHNFFQTIDLAKLAILACIMKWHFRACFEFCIWKMLGKFGKSMYVILCTKHIFLYNKWSTLKSLTLINLPNSQKLAKLTPNLPNVHQTCQIYICTNFCHTCQTGHLRVTAPKCYAPICMSTQLFLNTLKICIRLIHMRVAIDQFFFFKKLFKVVDCSVQFSVCLEPFVLLSNQ